MEIAASEFYRLIGIFFWSFTRIGAAVMTVPVIGTRMLPGRVRLVLAIVLAVIFVPSYNKYPNVDLLSLGSLLIFAQQLIIGVTIGLVLQLTFQIFLLLGEMVAMQSGLGFAILNDPNTSSSVPMVSQLYLILVSYLFMAFDGHLLFCKLLLGSFQLIPIDVYSLQFAGFQQVILLGSWMFANAFKIALPAITALLMVNVGFGVMTKAAPQLNIFSIGFPITMIMGVIIIWVNLKTIAPHFTKLLEYSATFLNNEILGGT